MRLPMIATSVDRISLVDSNTMIEVDGIEPQRVACKLDLTGRRTRRECHGPSWLRKRSPGQRRAVSRVR